MTTELEYMQLATRVYAASRLNEIDTPQGWSQVDWRPDGFTGFSAGIYTNDQDGEVVIAYTGTNDGIADPLNWTAGMGIPAPQIFEAMTYYLNYRKEHPEATNITFTGHSLGGGLASLMAVYFDRQATVFDEAPFQLAALSPVVLAAAASTMASSGYQDAAMTAFIESAGALAFARESNVTQYYVAGEVLNAIRTAPDTLLGHDNPIALGDSAASAVARHSMTLLTALRASDGFLAAVRTLPDLVEMMQDNDLFGADSRSELKTDLLRFLLRHQLGVEDAIQPDGMLDRFAADMAKIAQPGGLTMNSNIEGVESAITHALTAFAMQAYYDNRLGADETLFQEVAGGVHFDMSRVADTLEAARGYTGTDMYRMFTGYLNGLHGEQKDALLQQLPNLRDWYIQAGGQAMTATAGEQRALMLGGSGGDNLTGGGDADVLVGNMGHDTINGGAGDDLLLVGWGSDGFSDNTGDTLLFASSITDRQHHYGVGDEWFADDRQWRQAA
ncbi:MAG: lipase family protein [Thermodesulfobacteriota bacterium]